MKVLLLTNEYPPHIYGGAGVHVGYLSRELAKSMEVEVRCFGDQKLKKGNLCVTGFEIDASGFTCPQPLQSVFGAIRCCLDFNTTNIDANIVHCHTWYSHFGGILAKKNYGFCSSSRFIRLSRCDRGSANSLQADTTSAFGWRGPPWKWRMRSLRFREERKPISNGSSRSTRRGST